MLWAEIQFVPEQASTIARDYDPIIWFLHIMTIVCSTIIGVAVLYLGIRYRRRSDTEIPKPIHGSLALEIGWSLPVLIVGLILFFWSARLFIRMYEPPQDATEIKVVGKQWMWKLQHEDGGIREINELHVPMNQPVKLTMISEDVIHSFFIPAFRMKQDVIPGRVSTTWFEATKEGTYDLFCTEYCGTDHSRMIGKVHVMRQDDYAEWKRGALRMSDGSAASKGKLLFLKLGCITCHGKGTQYAPILEELHGTDVQVKVKATGKDEIVKFTDEYIRESILYPAEKVVAGYQPVMPTFKGQVSEDEIIQLTAYIKSLRKGQTPPRMEQSTPPFAKVEGAANEGNKNENNK